MEEENKNVESKNEEVETTVEDKVEDISEAKMENMDSELTSKVSNNIFESEVPVKKKNIIIYAIVTILILLLVGVLLFEFVFSKEKDNNNNNSTNVTSSDDVTHNDDIVTDVKVTVSDDVDGYVSVKEVKLQNYNTDKDVVIYNCKSVKCTIEDFKNGFIVFDDDSFYFKKISASEYELLFEENSDLVEPLILSMNNLEKIEPEKIMVLNYKNYDEDEKFYLYNLNNTFFVLSPPFYEEEYSIYRLFNEKEDGIYPKVVDDLLVYDSYLIDWKNKKVIYDNNICPYDYIEKIGEFYIAYEDACMTGSTPDKIFTEEYNFINSLYYQEYYIQDDKLYYIDEEKLKIVNSKNKLLSTYDDINPISFYESDLMYIDSDSHLAVKNVINEKIVLNYDINVIGYDLRLSFSKFDGEYHISMKGDYVWDDNKAIDVASNFKKFISDNNLNFNDFDKFVDSADVGDVIVYRLAFDEKGNFISDEFISDDWCCLF